MSASILFVTHYWPPSPQRFTLHEVVSWADLGLEIDVLGLRRTPAALLDYVPVRLLERAPRSRVLAELSFRCWLVGMGICLGKSLRFVRAAAAVAFGKYLRSSGTRNRLHAFITLLRAVGVASLVWRERIDHVHADFADDVATIAWFCHRTLGVSFSFRDHYSYNPQLIKEKVSDSSLVLACCESNKQALLGIAGSRRDAQVETSYLGIDLDFWRPVPIAALAQGYSVLCVGTLQEKKGQQYLIEAVAHLRREGTAVRAILVGDGPDREKLSKLASDLGVSDLLEMKGTRAEEETRAIVGATHVFCLPSVQTALGDHDGIPIALMEAMAMEKACISTAIGGIEELIEDDVSGCLVTPRDPESLANALLRLLTDPPEMARLGRNARKRVMERFSVYKNASQAAELIAKSFSTK